MNEEKVFVASGKKKGSVRREIKAVSGMRVTIVQNQHQKARQPLSHQHQEAEVRREKATSEAKASLGSSIDSRANTSWKVLARNRLVSIGILPNVNSIKQNRAVNSAECLFPHWKVEEQPNKKPTKGDDKSAVAIVKSVRQLSCVSQDTEPPDSATISGKGTKVLEPRRRVRLTRAALRQANIRENKGPSLKKIQVKIPHQRSPYAMKFEDRDLQERLKDKSDAPAETRGDLPNIFTSSKKRTKPHSVRLPMSGFCRPHPQ